ncbi:MAG: hypothetical protein N3B21_06270 [Clostridia bacterium]|nr:hypothetical protein [Clostridia bacterium]
MVSIWDINIDGNDNTVLAGSGIIANITRRHDVGKVSDMISTADKLLENKDYVNAIRGYEAAIENISSQKNPLEYAEAKNSIGIAFSEPAGAVNKESNITKAIIAYEDAFKIYTVKSYPTDYARVQGNLATAYLELSEIRDKEKNLTKAIQACQDCLKVFTLSEYASEYAQVQNLLGVAYNDLSQIRKNTH